MLIDETAYLEHYGTPRHSGRYPWGSGDKGFQNSGSFLSRIDELRKSGLNDTQIARSMGITTTEYRAYRSIAKNEKKQADIAMAQRLKDKGYSNVAIGERMGINESSVRSLLAPGEKDKADILTSTANMLKGQVEQKGYIDVGTGIERHIGVSRNQLDTAIKIAEAEGYSVHTVKIPQLGTGEMTTVKVMAKPGKTQKDIFMDREKIRSVSEFSEDGGRTYVAIQPPKSISSSRIAVRYAEDGGTDADGTIFVRPGVKDLSLGGSSYAQVRIAVDGSHYLKGMAVYKDDLPDGVDLMFNTNKSNTGNKHDAMKKMTDDPDNPFGASVKRQIIDPKTGKPSSAMNILNEEGDWDTWSRSLSTQMLSKQGLGLVKEQLNITYTSRQKQLDEIKSLTNPTVRRKLLETYADDVDSSAVQLKAAALPRQATKVILPVSGMKDNEVYAPTFRDGERVVLIRHPHGGIFEIPELIVNNRNPHGKKLLGQAKDAIGINSNVAERLSGADFDGDHVLVIPNNSGKVKTAPPLEGLKHFDPKAAYPAYEGMPRMTKEQKGMEMGKVSNLITDMTILGADSSEIARAVRHSMVVIDAEKHNLNYKQSAIDNGIPALAKKYQGKAGGGAATLISRATAQAYVPERKLRSAAKGGPVDRDTGKLVYEPTGRTKTTPTGKVVEKMVKSKRLAETDDAYTLSSGSPVESAYAEHSNRLKALANDARKEAVHTKPIPYSPSAKKVYAEEVASLDAKLNVALKNRPKERQAQVLANSVVSAKRRANPDMDKDTLRKEKARALNNARAQVGADKQAIEVSTREWEAIQAGAISTHKLTEILNNANMNRIRELALPKAETLLSTSQANKAKALLRAGHTQAEVADALGVSVSTINNIV